MVIRKEHVFSIDFRNSKAALTITSITSMAPVILLSFSGNIWQISRNSLLKDNDLKYRYIKMQGKATPKDLLRLETIFMYDRNRDSISVVLSSVETYERLVKEQAERIERKRLNTQKLRSTQKAEKRKNEESNLQ